MEIIPLLLKEIEEEAAITRKMLQIVPFEKFDWSPHAKSMKMGVLCIHIAELPGWVKMGLETTGLDFATMDYTPTIVNSIEELMALFEKSFSDGKSALSAAKEEDLLPTWTMRSGEKVLQVFTKYEVIRHAFAQTIHHRAQLGVFLRLLDIPIPGSYGPSADTMSSFG